MFELHVDALLLGLIHVRGSGHDVHVLNRSYVWVRVYMSLCHCAFVYPPPRCFWTPVAMQSVCGLMTGVFIGPVPNTLICRICPVRWN